MKKLTHVLPLFATLWIPMAFAEGSFYAGAGIGYAQVDGLAKGGGRVELEFPEFPGLPGITSAGIEGMSFNDGDVSGSVLLGYQITQYVSIELAATSLGSFDSERTLANQGHARVSIDEYALMAKLKYPMTPRLAANWRVGVTYSDFDVDGEAEVLFGYPDLVFVDREPYSDPDSETGWLWGFGFDWRLTPRISIELRYTQHDNQVLEAENIGLGLVFYFRRDAEPSNP